MIVNSVWYNVIDSRSKNFLPLRAIIGKKSEMNNQTGKPIVLVHGAWHGAWCWEKVIPILKEKGHETHAPDLPGLGEDETPVGEVTLDTYVNAVKQLVSDIDDKVILVGHSMGGLVITQAAEWLSDRIHALVYLAAFSPKDGEALSDYAWNDSRSYVTRYKQVNEAEGSVTVDPEKLPACFYGMCSAEDTQNAIARLRPQPLAPLTRPVKITPENYGSVRRYYIECTKDQALTWPMQQKMQPNARLDGLFTLETDHSPFYSCPGDLADCLVKL